VGELGDILEVLQDAEPRWWTLRAVGRNWRHQPRANEAFERHFAAMEAGQAPGSVVRLTASYVPEGPQPPVPDESEDSWRLWMEQAGRTRSEISYGDRSSMVVFDGPTWWSWSTDMGGMTNHGADNHQHGLGPAEGLLDTAALLSALRLESLGRGMLLGRDVVRLRGLPRVRHDRQPDHGLHALGVGADDYLLSVDAATGVVLSAEARLREQPFIAIEMTDVAFDVDLPPETFTIDLPLGETFEDVSQRGSGRWRPRRHRFPRMLRRKGAIPGR